MCVLTSSKDLIWDFVLIIPASLTPFHRYWALITHRGLEKCVVMRCNGQMEFAVRLYQYNILYIQSRARCVYYDEAYS